MAENDDPERIIQQNRILQYSDDSDTEEPAKFDLIGIATQNAKKDCLPDDQVEAQASASTSKDPPPKREENSSLSFKHFLRYDINNYQNLGARPKVYCDGRPITSISDLDLHQITTGKQTRIVPEFSSALPDFVQDHLVMEQSYLGKDLTNSYSLDLPNLPDFTPNRTSSVINRLNVDSSRDADSRTDSCSNASVLDLPTRPQAGFPLDLPIADPQPTTSRSCPPTAEAGVLKTLPDFLTDGPVRTQSNDGQSCSSPDREADRLRLELEVVRRDLVQQTLRADRLERQLEETRQSDQEYTQNLNRNYVQAQENLERCTRRAESAEKTIQKLRKDIKSLTSELHILKKDNYDLKGEASGGPSTSRGCNVETVNNSHRIGKELRAAADSAEFSLKQLLKGVDNLRLLASQVDSDFRIEETNEPYSDLDDADNEPAL